jgi:gliding motility-associated-like protein
MNKFKDISELEQLLKSNLQVHSTPAPPEVWSIVAASTGQSAGVLGQAMSFLNSTTNLLKVALFVGGIAAVGIVIHNENNAPSGAKSNQAIATNQPSSTEGTPLNILDSVPQTAKTELPNSESSVQQKNANKIKTRIRSEENSRKIDATNLSPAPTPETFQSADKLEAVSPTQQIVVTTHTDFEISNTQPCKGESVTLSQAIPTNWYVNGVQVAQNTATYSLKTPEAGVYFVSNGNQTKTIDVSLLSLRIITEEIETGRIRCKLEEGLIANWHLDDKLVHTNASTVDLEISDVGTHVVKSTILSHPCNVTLYKTITIEPTGSINFYEIFTPDGDGINDFYTVDISGYENFSIQIFDDNNRRIFLSQSPEKKWNGKVNNKGEACKIGTYYAKISYKLKGENPQVKTIKLVLKR